MTHAGAVLWSRADSGRTRTEQPGLAARRVARSITLGGIALFWLVATAWRPWNLLARGGFSSDFYDEQARALLRGRLDVDPAVAGIEGFVVDDRTYLYFGPLLAIVRLPFAVAGDWTAGRLTLLSMLIALAVACTWAFRLYGLALRAVRGRELDDRDTWRVALLLGAVVGSPLLALSGWISVYHETELWACALALVTAASTIALVEEPSARRGLLVGVAAACTVLVRASVGIGVVVGLLAVIAIVWAMGRLGPRQQSSLRPFAPAAGLALGGLAIHVGVNLARFGSPLSLPADRQVLTLVDAERAAWFAGNDGSFFSVRFLPTTLLHYLRPDTVRLERLVPGVRFGPPAADVGAYPMETITPSASLTAAAPVLVALAVVGLIALVRRQAHPAWLVLTAGLAVGAAPSFLIGFVANRYLVDMLPMLIVPAALGVVLVRRPGWASARAARSAVVVAVVASVWVNAALGTWILGLKSPGFTELRYRLDALVLPAPSPGLTVDPTPGSVPRDGIVALDLVEASCRGVYIAEQGRWVALERDHRREARGALVAAPGDPLVQTDDWSIERRDAALALVVDGNEVVELPAPGLDPGAAIVVVADPVVPELSVSTPTATVLFDATVPGRGERLETPGLNGRRVELSGPTTDPPLCAVLLPRR